MILDGHAGGLIVILHKSDLSRNAWNHIHAALPFIVRLRKPRIGYIYTIIMLTQARLECVHDRNGQAAQQAQDPPIALRAERQDHRHLAAAGPTHSHDKT